MHLPDSEIKRIFWILVFCAIAYILYHYSPAYKNKSLISIQSFNINADCDSSLDSRNDYSHWHNRKLDIIDILSFPKADILCVQSIPEHQKLDFLKSNLPQYELTNHTHCLAHACSSTATFYNPKHLSLISTYTYNSLLPIQVSHFSHNKLPSFNIINASIPENFDISNITTLIDIVKSYSHQPTALCISSQSPHTSNFLTTELKKLSLISSYNNFVSSKDHKKFYTYKKNDSSSPTISDFIFTNISNSPRVIPQITQHSSLPDRERLLPSLHIYLVSDLIL